MRWLFVASLGLSLGSAECAVAPAIAEEPPVLIGSSDDDLSVQVFVVRLGSTERCYLTADSNMNIRPAWSYDGTKIVYTSMQGVASTIWTMDANGTNKKPLAFSGAGFPVVAAFSPDGTRIVYSGVQTGHSEIWVMNSDGTNQRQLTKTTRSAVTRTFRTVTWSAHPSYSPDGTKIVYSSTQSGKTQIWVMNADGTNQTQLTFPGYPAAPDANAPAWSPDGKRIAFWSGYVREYGEIWVMNADGTGRRQLTFMNGVNSDYTKLTFNSDEATWSPDGNHIIFNSTAPSTPSGSRTWIMGSDGSNPMVLLPFAHGASSRPLRTARDPVRFECRNTMPCILRR